MKKITIALLSLMLFSQAQSADTALNWLGNTVFTLSKVAPTAGPGAYDYYGAKKLYKEFNTNAYQPVCKQAQTEITEIWQKNGIDMSNVRIVTGSTKETPLPCGVFDYRHYGFPKVHLVLHLTTDEMFKYNNPSNPNHQMLMLLRKAFMQHESQHVLYRDEAMRAGLLWGAGIASYLSATAVQSLVGDYLAAIPGAQSTVQMATIFGTRELLLGKAKKALINAQEKRADLSITDPEQLSAMISQVKREKEQANGENPQWHVPYDVRIAYLENHLQKIKEEQNEKAE